MKHPAIAVFILQTAITVAVVTIGYVFEGLAFAYSAAIGGCIAIVPQGLFGFWVFRNRGARNSHLIARDLFMGEGLKLGVTAILFALVWTNFNQIEIKAEPIGGNSNDDDSGACSKLTSNAATKTQCEGDAIIFKYTY